MEVKPFKAFRFDEAKVGDVGSCIAPPYDVISPGQQQQLYEKSQYNIVRIIQGKKSDSDDDKNNKYTRAADYLNTWLQEGILRQDTSETIYAYAQDFQVAGREFRRLTFIALAKIEEYGRTVRQHENTFEEHIKDRLNLQRATSARFGLVFLLYEDKQKIADKVIEEAARQKPLVDFCDEQDVRHRLFAIADKENIDVIVNMMRDKSCIIADGHHRYETGLSYLRETTNPAAAYQMMAFANTCHEGLAILATHRLVGRLENFQAAKLLGQMKENFEVTDLPFDSPDGKTEARKEMIRQMKLAYNEHKNALGIYSGNGAFYVAVVKEGNAMDSAALNMSKPWRSLDVVVLHKLILEKLLAIDETRLANHTKYVKDTENAMDESIAEVDRGEQQVAFFMNPPKMEQIRMVAEAGERMPQKSTYFYPKIYTGLT
ncbi:MAG: DUF1015 domain-containing protein, partial [Planctomycetota bacterium]